MKIQILILTTVLLSQCIPATNSGNDDNTAIALLLVDDNPITKENSTQSMDKVATEKSDGYFSTVVNASSTKEWVYIDLKSGGVQVFESGNWDMRFKRFIIGTNSGTSGSGNAGSCDSGITNFSLVDSSSNCLGGKFLIDSPQSQDGQGFGDANDSASPVLFEWYSYSNTVLTPKSNVYLIQGSDGVSTFKLQMKDYYSSAGTSGYPRFIWDKL